MSWQDDLQQLDEDLKAGRVTAEEYRYRRDTLLAQSASGGGYDAPPAPGGPGQAPPTEGQQSPAGGERTQFVRPASPPSGFPAPGGGPSGGPSDNAERTQVVRPTGQQQWGPQQGSQQGGGDWGAQQPGGWGQQGDAGWGESGGDEPLWGGAELPSLASANQGAGFSQGPEVFAEDGKKSKKLWAILGVVVLVVVVVVAFLVFKPSSKSGGSAGGTTGAPTATTAPPTTTSAGPIVSLPGTTTPNTVKTFTDVVAAGFLTSDEVTAFNTGQPTTAYFAYSNHGANRILVVVVQEDSTSDANTVAGKLSQLETGYGLQPNSAGPAGVYLAGVATGAGPLRRAEYASGSSVVRIEVGGHDAASADQDMTNVLRSQLSRLPANG